MKIGNILIKIANSLDNRGFYNLASEVDDILIRLAMSFDDALSILGISSQSPSNDEIQSAYRRMAFENHPDRGGSLEEMKKINVARDVLLKAS